MTGLALPFLGVPVKDYHVNSIREAVMKLGVEIEIKITDESRRALGFFSSGAGELERFYVAEELAEKLIMKKPNLSLERKFLDDGNIVLFKFLKQLLVEKSRNGGYRKNLEWTHGDLSEKKLIPKGFITEYSSWSITFLSPI